MTAELTHTGFFGDGERNFLLTPELIVELERKTGAGIGSLCRRLFAGEFKHAEITETIRLALIGGGTSPKEAGRPCRGLCGQASVRRNFSARCGDLECAVVRRSKERRRQ